MAISIKKKMQKKAQQEEARKPKKASGLKKRAAEADDEEEEEEEEEEKPKRKIGAKLGKKKPSRDEEEDEEEEEEAEEEEEEEKPKRKLVGKGSASSAKGSVKGKLADRKQKKAKGKGGSYYAGFEDQDTGYDTRYLTAGNYLLELVRIEQAETRRKGDMFFAHFKVLESEGDEAIEEGGSATWSMKLDLDAAPRNIKSFVVALTGLEPSEIDEDFMLDVILSEDEDHPLKGTQIIAEAYEREKKNGEGVFTAIKWEHVSGQEYPWD